MATRDEQTTSSSSLLLTGLFLLVQSARGQLATPRFIPQPGSRVILLGNTFADRMRHYSYRETLLQQQFPGQQLTVRNMGWSADEVGLQPRPLNFPGFGEKTTRLTTGQPEVAFQGFTHGNEGTAMPVVLNFVGLNQDLSDQKADVLFLCFGMNEAFKGPASLPQFEKDLRAFIANLRANRYNGRSAPVLVLVSPIVHESQGGHVPDPTEHNANLARYTRTMQQTADTNGLHFVDLFTPSLARMKSGQKPITINGIHLNDEGYRMAADWVGQALGWGRLADPDSERSRQLRQVINWKDTHFFYRWRAVNGEYIYGRRREPFGVIAFPPELRKLNQMVAALDSVIWELGQNPGTEAYAKARYLLDLTPTPELLTLPQTGALRTALLVWPDLEPARHRELLRQQAEAEHSSQARVLLRIIRAQAAKKGVAGPTEAPRHLARLLLAGSPAELKPLISESIRLIRQDTSQFARALGYAVVIKANQSDRAVWPLAQASPSGRANYLTGLSILPDGALKTSFQGKVNRLTAHEPALAYPLLVRLSATPDGKLQSLNAFVAFLSNTPEAGQNTPAFGHLMGLAKGLVADVPAKNRPALLAKLEGIGSLEINLKALEAKMAFDKMSLVVRAGKSVSILFENPDMMPHNVVIVKPGSPQQVGEAADAMARLKDGFERNFVPDTPDVLFHSPLVNAGQRFRLTFKAPAEPGQYPFLCTFPGHWRVMQGVLTVKEVKKSVTATQSVARSGSGKVSEPEQSIFTSTHETPL